MLTMDDMKAFAVIAERLSLETQMLESMMRFAEQAEHGEENGAEIRAEIERCEDNIRYLRAKYERKRPDVENLVARVDDLYIRTLMTLHYIRGLSWENISIITRAKRGATRSRVYRALEKAGLYDETQAKPERAGLKTGRALRSEGGR